MKISVVLPIYKEKENVAPMMAQIVNVMRENNWGYEIIAVDDGSMDETRQELEKVGKSDSNIKLVFLRRNYGQSTAFSAGFQFVTGDIVVTMDADLQNDPADIPKMIAFLDRGYDFVTGWRKNRQDSLIRTFPSRIANFIIRKVTKTRLHDMGCSLKVYRAEIVRDLYLYGEMHRFISVLVENMGYKTTECEVHHRPRIAGQSKYGMVRIIKVLLDLLIVWFMRSYQTKSIYVFGSAAIGSFFISGFLSAFVLYQKFALGFWAHKNPLFVIAAVLGVASFQFLGMGILSEVLCRTYFESQHKRTYNIAKTTNLKTGQSTDQVKGIRLAS